MEETVPAGDKGALPLLRAPQFEPGPFHPLSEEQGGLVFMKFAGGEFKKEDVGFTHPPEKGNVVFGDNMASPETGALESRLGVDEGKVVGDFLSDGLLHGEGFHNHVRVTAIPPFRKKRTVHRQR